MIRPSMADLIRERSHLVPETPTGKVCTACKRDLPFEDFASRRVGLQSWCRECTREAVRRRRANG